MINELVAQSTCHNMSEPLGFSPSDLMILSGMVIERKASYAIEPQYHEMLRFFYCMDI